MSIPGQESMKEKPLIAARVQMISGCKDEQTSGDVGNVAAFGLPAEVGPGGAGGACTNSMMQTFYKNDDTPDIPDVEMTWAQLLVDMRTCLQAKGFTQIPQLSTSYNMHLGTPFTVKPTNARRTKALLIGINYVGHQVGVLSGCHNDVRVMKQFIVSQGFSDAPDRMRTLMDDGSSEMPNKQNIEQAMLWLIADAQPGDALFLHYSGHGSQVEDVSGDEESGFDQTMVPADYQHSGQIIDDWILESVVMPLPDGVHMFCVMDCCHSGSIMDLPFEITVTPELAQSVKMIIEEEKLNPGSAQGVAQLETDSTFAVQENPSFKKLAAKYMEKHKSVLAKMAMAGAAGAAAGTVVGPVGTCLGCLAGICGVAYAYQEEAKALGHDAKADARDIAQVQGIV